MCGIWACINQVSNLLSQEEKYKLFMALQHRGPNLSTFTNYAEDKLTVGFHRLEIIDRTFRSNQPFVLYDKTKIIIFICNGEIYNFENIIETYKLEMETHADCLTIPKLYIKLGCDFDKFKQCFTSYIKGEYAFVMIELDRTDELSGYFQATYTENGLFCDKIVDPGAKLPKTKASCNHFECVGSGSCKIQKIKRNSIKVIFARDAIGVRPLYRTTEVNIDNQTIYFSSEMKGLIHPNLNPPQEVEPGVIECMIFSNSELTLSRRYDMLNHSFYHPPEYEKIDASALKEVVKKVVHRRLQADRPIGFLLSGGVDSSLVAALSMSKFNGEFGPRLHTFCCGFENSPDLQYASQVAKRLGSIHTEVIFTPEEAIACIPDVIYTTETWDTTTIRASVGQYLVSKYISENTDIKVVLVGEGPDEVCSSYLFNYYAPNSQALHEASVEYVKKIHLYDGRRVDRCTSRWGLECRIPFLDPEFIRAYWTIDPARRHPKHGGIEKFEFRNLFKHDYLLPEEVLWRKKEAFSDGISQKTNSWFSILQNHISQIVTDEEFQNCHPQLASPTKEAFYYKKLFAERFGTRSLRVIPGYWQPKWIDKDGNVPVAYVDPSARVLDVY